MAIYYLNVQIIGRSTGRSATGAAAYRAGERIQDDRTGQTYDYTRRRGEMETEILSPAGAPEWVQDRSRLWNEVEKAERRADAQVAREIVVAFPIELNPDQQRDLIRSYVQAEFVSKGMVADVAIHRNPGNPHAHIMLTLREVGPGGLSPRKNREWNKPEQLERWREQWSVQANRALERAGRTERVDHRSLAEQGVDRLPQVHLGPHASSLERRGITTDKGDHNRLVAEHNAVVIDLQKARAEKQAVEAERMVQAKVVKLVQAGWLPDHAKAMVEVERLNGGRRLTLSQARDKHADLVVKFNTATCQIREIEHQGHKLTAAAKALEAHHKAQEELRRLQSPLASLRRLFSKSARDECQLVTYRVEWTGANVEATGIKTSEELNTRRAQWQQEMTTIPNLQRQADELKQKADLYSRAARGLEYEETRRRMAAEQARGPSRETDSRWIFDRQRSRSDRGIDRGR